MKYVDWNSKTGLPLPLAVLFFAIFTFLLHNERVFVGAVSVEEDLSLTSSQKVSLDKFKRIMLPRLPHDYMRQDIYLIRWLRAQHFNLKLAENMLIRNLEWRNENRMDTIQTEDWSDMKDEFEYTNDTFDKKGRPIGTIAFGHWNLRKAALSGQIPRVARYLEKLLEEATQAVIREQRLGRNVTQWKVLIDLDGFNLVQHGCAACLPQYATFVTTYENRYPGHADAHILINMPPAFEVVLNIMRPIFTEPTRQALKIFGTDKRQWMDYLDREISCEQRRPEYGGTKRN